MFGPAYQVCVATDRPNDDFDSEINRSLSAHEQSDLLNALDLTPPELVKVADAWKRNDASAAQRELVRYFRTRSSVGWNTEYGNHPPLSPDNVEVADAAVQGRFRGGLVPLVYRFPNGNIDWHFNATYYVPGQAPNDEWQWQLNRMSFWSDLAVAYRATGDERYARAFVQELRSWIAQCPVPNHIDNVPGSSWRPIEAGIRAGGSWPEAFFAFRRSPAMSDADLIAFIHAFLEHGRYLRNYHTKLNHLTMEMSGLYAIGAAFPELKDAAEWRSYAANTLAKEARKQFLPDGAQMELSTGYQNVAIDSILRIAEIARWTGRESELQANYAAPLEKAYEWQVDIVAPDRYLPKINDSWPVFLPTVLKKAATNFPNRSDFRWFATNGDDGAPPPFTSIFLDRSGLAAMRSGWDLDANYLLFRLGPLGLGHQHQDKLDVLLWAYGRELIFSSGGGTFEKSKWREWAISSFGHNTVVVDDMSQSRTINEDDPLHDPEMVSQGPINANWQTNTAFDFASGTYTQGYGARHIPIAFQQRDVLFLKPNLYVVVDRLHPNDSFSHKYQARWQILTTHSRLDPATHSLITEDSGMANIAVIPLLSKGLQVTSASGQEAPEILGWNIRKDEDPQVVPATTLLHTLTGNGPQLILTLFVPLRPGEANPVASVEPGRDGVSATVTFSDGRRMLIACPGSLGVSIQETLPDGKQGRSAVGGK